MLVVGWPPSTQHNSRGEMLLLLMMGGGGGAVLLLCTHKTDTKAKNFATMSAELCGDLCVVAQNLAGSPCPSLVLIHLWGTPAAAAAS